MKTKAMLAVALGAMAVVEAAAADLSLSPYWQDHMVIQRGKPVTVWGKDAAGRTVTVSFAGQTANAVTGSDGSWEATFAQTFAASATAQALTVTDSASESITISDILVGDVYLCSGQSNMHFMLSEDNSAAKSFCSSAGDGVRAIHVPENQSNSTAYDLPETTSYDSYGTGWGSCATESHRNKITSVGLNFACYLREANPGVPIGIVQAAFRGAGIDGFRKGAMIWNAMMAPYAKAQFCGVLWYQGESDAGKTADAYATLLHALVGDWRSVWGEDLPFYAVQIATPGAYYGASATDTPPEPNTAADSFNYTSIREGLRLWDESETGTHGLAVICDFVECLQNRDLHPYDKNTVGRRLSLFALRDIYGRSTLQAEGPKYDAAVGNSDGSITVSFKSGTATGLTAGKVIQCSGTTVSSWTSTADSIKGFALKGADGTWRAATATVNGSAVVLTADGISADNKATQFHYGYWNFTRDSTSDDGQRMTLYNASGLPLSPVAPQTISSEDPTPTVASPSFSPASCSFYPSTNVTLACTTEGATIRYTLDGSDPTTNSTAYTEPIALSATTTVKARAFADEMNPSVIVSAIYTYTDPSTSVLTWTTSEFDPSAWSALGNNLLLNQEGTLTGTKSYMTSDITKITDGAIPSSNAQVADTFGFAVDATVEWSFDSTNTLHKIRFTTCYIANHGQYDDIKIAKIEVKTSGSDSWTDLGADALDYAGSGTAGTALSAMLENTTLGYLAQNVTALRITFGQQNNVAQYYAEIEAVGTASGSPASTAATPAFNPDSCNFYPSTNVTLTCATEGATIRYTLDGSEPTAESTAYTTPIALSSTTTVKARAFANGTNPSAVASATYTYTDPSTPITPGTWTTNALAPSDWSPLANNLLSGLTGTISGATAGSAYASTDPNLLTDSSVPTAGGAAYIVGFQNNALISWTFANPVTLGKVRISCGYLAQTGYSGFTVSSVEVQTSGSTEWTEVSMTTGQMKDTGQSDILTLTLANENGATLAANAVALRVTFATPPVGFANYCAEIEAVGSSASDKIYPDWIDATDSAVTAKYDAWAAKFNVADPTAARQDAYLLNCANTAEAVAEAKAAFTVVSIAVNADGTVDVGMPTAPEGGFNGTVTILGCTTVGGEYHAVTAGTLNDALFNVPASSNDHFFMAALE